MQEDVRGKRQVVPTLFKDLRIEQLTALRFRCYWIALAAASISLALARMRKSSVKLVQRTVPEVSTRNSAGRAMSLPPGPPPLCSRL